MKIDLSQFRNSFFQEAAELLGELEAGLLRLERQADDADTLNAVFRAAHSIKGSAGMLEMIEIQRFTHSLESLLDAMRAGQVEVNRPRLGLLLQAADTLRSLVQWEQKGGSRPESAAEIARLLSDGLAASPAPVWAIRMRPDQGCLARGLDPLNLLEELDRLGRVLVSRLDCDRLPALVDLDPMQCHLAWEVRLETGRDRAAIDDLLDWFGVDASCEPVSGRRQPEADRPATPPTPDQAPAAESVQVKAQSEPSASVRVAVEKIDQLVTLAGELAVAHSICSEVAGNFRPERWPELELALNDIGRQVWLLQQSVLSVRMLPAAELFRKLPRLVWELESATGKPLDLELEGEDAEMDKSVAERLADPLTHLVRNAADHGIEPPEERKRSGKPLRGKIRVRALHESGDVVFEISDDGRGLEAARIRAKAIERGLVEPGTNLPDQALFQLIFEPGFSTASAVTNLSGRGVGMDVVRRNVEELGGAITLASQPGRGTMFRIRLPLTLAILDGLLVTIAGGFYLIPMTAILKSVEPGLVTQVPGLTGVVVIDGVATPLAEAAGLFRLPARPAERPLAVVIQKDGARAAVLVDELVGRQQVIVRSLEDHYRKVPGLLGASILGDGGVALILDPGWMIHRACGEEAFK